MTVCEKLFIMHFFIIDIAATRLLENSSFVDPEVKGAVYAARKKQY